MFLTQFIVKFLGMGISITTRNSVLGVTILTAFLLVGFTSAYALTFDEASQTISEFFEDLTSGLFQFSEAHLVADLIQFDITSPVDGGVTSSNQLFVSTTLSFGSSSSSGTVKLHVHHDPPDGASSSVVKMATGQGCTFDVDPEKNQSCTISQLFVALASPLPEGDYTITRTYTSNDEATHPETTSGRIESVPGEFPAVISPPSISLLGFPAGSCRIRLT